MRAIMVSVNYSDLLAITLPYNRQHFDEVYVVTSRADCPNVAPITDANDARFLATDLFYENGASFNKWAALEWGLDQIGRKGWLCIMDADVLWPKDGKDSLTRIMQRGFLLSPLRRMMIDLPAPFTRESIPEESKWKEYPIHRNVNEWAGYSQIFHAEDIHLGAAPWHQTDWKHAGGADSFFQAKWPLQFKLRPNFHCLHLGPAGVNWMGRASRYLDGSEPEGAGDKCRAVQGIWAERHLRRRRGEDPFAPEKI